MRISDWSSDVCSSDLTERGSLGHDGEETGRPLIRAAQYVRMSTEHQQYSTENQSEAMRQYAERRGIEIVRSYADEGGSGLRLDGRDALKQLIEEVQSGTADLTVILVRSEELTYEPKSLKRNSH